MSVRPRIRAAFLGLCLVAIAGALVVASVGGRGRAQTPTERAHAVAETLRCPVCLNLSVADSTSGVARQMRRTIAEELRAGMSPDQIRSRFVGAYGEWILIDPPKRGLGLAIWLVPVAVVLAGLVVTVVAVRRWARRGAGPGGALQPTREGPPA